METVLIADDESAIREGLKYIIDWGAYNFTVCGTAANGEEALAMIQSLNPSLVLIDIRMPKMHGIEVIEAARNSGFTGKIIIVSGYSDFKYAQSAIKFGVDYYLTKPIDENELIHVVEEVRSSIDEQAQTSMVMEHYRQKAKKEILHDIVLGTSDIELISKSDMHLEADVYQVVIYETFRKNSTDMPYQFSELLRVTNHGSHTFEHFEEDGKEVIILKGDLALDKLQKFLDHYIKTPPQKGSPLDTLFIAYGCPVHKISDIYLSYAQAAQLITRRFFCIKGQHTLGYKELPNMEDKDLELLHEQMSAYCDTITNYLQAFNRKMINETILQLSDYLYNVNAGISSVKLFLTDLYLQVKENMNRLYTTLNIPFSSNSAIIELIDSKYYLYEIIQYFSEQFEMIMSAIGSSSRDSILDDILYYIDHNYQANIKLESIAPLFGYNSAYLGKIFNKAVGENFNNYVDHIRIDHAKELILENKKKVYEIAEQVGYKNVDYFHKKFKKYVGESPAEYRKKFVAKPID